MKPSPAVPIRPEWMSAAGILGEGLSLLRRHAGTFLGIAAVTFVPAFAVDLADAQFPDDPYFVRLFALARLACLPIHLVGMATIWVVVAQVLADEPPGRARPSATR